MFRRKEIHKASKFNEIGKGKESKAITNACSCADDVCQDIIDKSDQYSSDMCSKFCPALLNRVSDKLYPKEEVMIFAYPFVEKNKLSNFAAKFSKYFLLIDYQTGLICQKDSYNKPEKDPPMDDCFCITNKFCWLDTSICLGEILKHPDLDYYVLVFYNVDDYLPLLTLINFYKMLNLGNQFKDINVLKMLYKKDPFIKEEDGTFYQNCIDLADRLGAQTFATALKSRSEL